MIDAEYEQLLAALMEAAAVFARHDGGFSSADLRIRSLVRLASREVSLAHLQTNSRTHRLAVAARMPPRPDSRGIEVARAPHSPPNAHVA